MNRISSGATFFYKRILPVIWFGFLGVIVCFAVVFGVKNFLVMIPFIVFFMMVAVVGFVVLKWVVFGLVDEVWDRGDGLLVRNRGHEERIAFTDCVNVNYNGFINPPRITIMLRRSSAFGNEISFVPPFRFFPYSTPPVARDLIARIDAARQGSLD